MMMNDKNLMEKIELLMDNDCDMNTVAKVLDMSTTDLRKFISEYNAYRWKLNLRAYEALKNAGFNREDISVVMRVNESTVRAWEKQNEIDEAIKEALNEAVEKFGEDLKKYTEVYKRVADSIGNIGV